MYLSLLAGDTVQAIGFILSFHYIDGPPATPSSTFCSAQGAFIQAGDLSIALSTTLLALHTCYVRGRACDAVLTAQTVLRRRRAHRRAHDLAARDLVSARRSAGTTTILCAEPAACID